jgi:transposase
MNLIDSCPPVREQSIQRQRPLPSWLSSTRPYIDQHVAVAEQAAEKTLTASQKLTVLESGCGG